VCVAASLAHLANLLSRISADFASAVLSPKMPEKVAKDPLTLVPCLCIRSILFVTALHKELRRVWLQAWLSKYLYCLKSALTLPQCYGSAVSKKARESCQSSTYLGSLTM
jgi:hypothetical protein